jgi:prevent-host-death family protein
MTMVKKTNPKQIGAAEFKAKCLQIMDRVMQNKQPIVVTKHGKPVVRILPVEEPAPDALFGCLADRFQIMGDVQEPVLPAELWSGRK